MAIDIGKKLVADFNKIEDLETDYLSEITSLSKIFISLAIAILGLSMSQSIPDLSKKTGLLWLISTWICLILSAIFGFIEIFFFSRRFKKKADYIQNSLLVAVSKSVSFPNSEAKLKEFLTKSNREKEKFDRHYGLCSIFIACQAILLLIAFILFGTFIYKNIRID